MQDWFEYIFSKYIDDMYRLAYSYTHNKYDSEDIIQRVFLKYFNKQNTINKNDIVVKKWLIVATINECKDLFKSNWKKKVNFLDNDFDIAKEDKLENYFNNYMNKLPKKYRIIFHLYYYYGYTTKEISTITKIKESTVRQRLARGRKILKLERDYENEKI